ncbi:metallophos domain-containing protein [Haematococcus lacustris]|uniref:Metallophos domain-containing protein n=1 Tax=Haematococcus lacustris TaxID=44745 RepID=A0A6A0A6N8_HAELA|nr:metallophos domain-containing protein [Haematococcus lacustris]
MPASQPAWWLPPHAACAKYHSGLKGPADPTFTQTFTSVYTDKSLMVPWYAVLGNHDYGELDSKQLRLCSSPTFSSCPAGCCYSPSWQTNMSHLDWRWNAHQGAWRRSFGDGLLDIVFVDTTPFLTKSPVCSQQGGISSQDQAGQAKAVQALMRNSTARWKVVVGHHPVRSYGEHCKGGKGGDCVDMQWLRPIMAEHQAAAYFSGHEHDLQLIKSKATASPPDPVYYVVSGAGSDIRDHDFSNW